MLLNSLRDPFALHNAPTVTVVVAANDTPNKTDRADYVCDGVDDHLTMQVANDALPGIGGVIKLCEGTYAMDGNLELSDNVSLIGCGPATLLNFDHVQNVGIINDDTIGGNHNITIAHMKLDGFDKTNDPIELQNASRCNIHHLELTRGNHDGIELSGCNDCIISNVIAHDSHTYHGIELDDDSSDCSILGCIVYNNPDSGIVLDGTSHDNLVTGCISRNNTGNGIVLNPSTVNNTVFGNLTHDNTVKGVYDQGTGNLTVSDESRRFGLGIRDPLYTFSVGSADHSDQVGLFHDNANAYLVWDDGDLICKTDEGTNTNTYVYIRGKGTGYGSVRVCDQDDAEYASVTCADGRAHFRIEGTSPVALDIQSAADVPVRVFAGAAEGQTPEFEVYGYRTGDAKRSLQIGVGVDAADTVSFDGLSNYYFDGALLIGAMKSGATQSAAGAAANELWRTIGHATLPDNVVMMGV